MATTFRALLPTACHFSVAPQGAIPQPTFCNLPSDGIVLDGALRPRDLREPRRPHF